MPIDVLAFLLMRLDPRLTMGRARTSIIGGSRKCCMPEPVQASGRSNPVTATQLPKQARSRSSYSFLAASPCGQWRFCRANRYRYVATIAASTSFENGSTHSATRS